MADGAPPGLAHLLVDISTSRLGQEAEEWDDTMSQSELPMGAPGINSVKALHKRNLATLPDGERQTLEFYRAQGRKFGVHIHIDSDADPAELARACPKAQADEIMRRANSVVHVRLDDG